MKVNIEFTDRPSMFKICDTYFLSEGYFWFEDGNKMDCFSAAIVKSIEVHKEDVKVSVGWSDKAISETFKTMLEKERRPGGLLSK